MMGSSGGSSGGGVSDTTYHFAPYLEAAHQSLIVAAWNAFYIIAADASPWDGFDLEDADLWFLGSVNLAVMPVYDIVQTYVTGVDLEGLYASIYTASVNDPVTNALISAQDTNLQDDIDQNAVPRMNAGLRDINAVMSSSFITNKALLQAQKTKAMATFAADVKMKGVDVAVHRWTRTLDWNIQATDSYIKFSHIRWQAKFDYINTETELILKRMLWPFTALDMMKGIISTLNGAGGGEVKGVSKTQALMGGILGGVSMLGNTASAMAGGYKALQATGLVGAAAGGGSAASGAAGMAGAATSVANAGGMTVGAGLGIESFVADMAIAALTY